MTKLFNKSETLYKRKRLRTEQTAAEIELWEKIRDNQLGHKFRRQYSIGQYIVDFYCPQSKLAIELDGSQHNTKDGLEYDTIRTEYINSLNIKVLRFTNLEVINNLNKVIEAIKEKIL